MFYSIRHLTKFRYSAPVSESLMELRMHPRSEGLQRCLNFKLSVTPRRGCNHYRDYLGNVVHHFDVPSPHRQLTIMAEAMVDVAPQLGLPRCGSVTDAWDRAGRDQSPSGDFWEMLAPSHFAQWTERIEDFARRTEAADRRERAGSDPLELLLELNAAVYHAIEYVPKSTRVILRSTTRCGIGRASARILRTS